MILPKVRDPRFITVRRGGTLRDNDHHLLALWAAACAEHVLPLFEAVQTSDLRPRRAIKQARAGVRGEVKMMETRAVGGAANSAVRPLSGAPRFAAYAARRPWWPTSPLTNSALRPTRSRRRARLPLGATPSASAGSSAGGSAISCPRRFANSFLTTSGSETTSAGRSSTAERRLPARGCPTNRCS